MKTKAHSITQRFYVFAILPNPESPISYHVTPYKMEMPNLPEDLYPIGEVDVVLDLMVPEDFHELVVTTLREQLKNLKGVHHAAEVGIEAKIQKFLAIEG